MLKAYSLVYALLLSLLIGMTSVSLVLYQHLYRVQAQRWETTERLVYTSQLGMKVLMQNQSPLVGSAQMQVDLFGDKRDSVLLEQRSWGLFELATATAFKRKQTHRRQALVGRLPAPSEPALYLSDRNKALALCGRTIIKGTVYLPKAGVKRAYIEGKSFVGKQLIDGKRELAKRHLPDLSAVVEEAALVLEQSSATDSLVSWDFFDITAHHQSWHKKRLVIESTDRIILDREQLSGQIVIRSDVEIIIGSGSRLTDVILVAPRIEIERGFNGSLQAFASEELLVDEQVTLEYPSVAGILRNKTGDAPTLTLSAKSRINGIVFLKAPAVPTGRQPLVEILENATVQGQVYVKGNLALLGEIEGSVYCSAFELKTNSASYENHLLDASIDHSKRPSAFVGINMLENGGQKAIVKWL